MTQLSTLCTWFIIIILELSCQFLVLFSFFLDLVQNVGASYNYCGIQARDFFFFFSERIAKKPICLHSSIVVLFLKHVLYSMQWFFSIRIKFKIYSSIRFVRFVSTPEVLERVNTIETEMLQIDEAIAIQSSENPGLNTVSVCLDQILIFFISKKESSPFLLFVAGRRSSVKIQRKH